MSRKDPPHENSHRKPLARSQRASHGEPAYERLEARKLLAVAQISLRAGLLAIVSDNTATHLELSSAGSK
ncbi:MAG: hypothetical protein ACKO81_12270, partial [Planctomycetota bacterium]